MSDAEIDDLAQALYLERVAERGPRCDQLGEVTKSVWREYALLELAGDLV